MNFKRRKIATLDLGTNSLLMLIAERNEEGIVTILDDQSATPRIGEGLRNSGRIQPEALDRTCQALEAFVTRAKTQNADIAVTATSAVRECENQKEVLSKLSAIVGKEVEVLTANEEARLTYYSAALEKGGDDPTMVVDIGGGSTEVTWGIGPRFDGGRSLNLGTVKLLEGPFKQDPPPPAQMDETRKEIDRQLARITPLNQLDHYYGTAGSFTHLAAIDLKLTEYHPNKVTGHELRPETIKQWFEKLASMSREERLKVPGVDPQRVDVLLPGTLIIERLFHKFQNPSFTVIDRGIRFGKLFDMLRNFNPPLRWE